MRSTTRDAALVRDAGVERIRTTTRRIGGLAVAGTLLAAAGFAHLIPTHLPHLSVGQSGGGNSGSGSTGTSNGGGLQGPVTAPGGGSGPSHVTSGGS